MKSTRRFSIMNIYFKTSLIRITLMNINYHVIYHNEFYIIISFTMTRTHKHRGQYYYNSFHYVNYVNYLNLLIEG